MVASDLFVIFMLPPASRVRSRGKRTVPWVLYEQEGNVIITSKAPAGFGRCYEVIEQCFVVLQDQGKKSETRAR
eukprot:12915510-Prorocentrum_lima.AAC.1